MNKIIEEAKKINEFDYIPELEIGETVELNDVWDGNGETPDGNFSYLLTNKGHDGKSNYDVSLNYEWEIIEEKENPLDTIIKITNIELI